MSFLGFSARIPWGTFSILVPKQLFLQYNAAIEVKYFISMSPEPCESSQCNTQITFIPLYKVPASINQILHQGPLLITRVSFSSILIICSNNKF